MNAAERDEALLRYIQESIERIGQYTASGREAFLAEAMAQDAVLRRLETLADAANKLSAELKARHPEIRWRAIYGFRNVAAHDYLRIQWDVVWETIDLHLPALKAVVDAELSRGA